MQRGAQDFGLGHRALSVRPVTGAPFRRAPGHPSGRGTAATKRESVAATLRHAPARTPAIPLVSSRSAEQYARPAMPAESDAPGLVSGMVSVRLATLDDAPAIRTIYNVEVTGPHQHVRPRPTDAGRAAGMARRPLRCVLRRGRHAARRAGRGRRFRVAVAVQGTGRVPHDRRELGLRVARTRRPGHRHGADAPRDRRRPRLRLPRHRRPHRGVERGVPQRCTPRSVSSWSASNARSAASSTAGSTSRSCS